jgi:O-acetyl-ADP-ribose deacetylase (regulator of RNase III)
MLVTFFDINDYKNNEIKTIYCEKLIIETKHLQKRIAFISPSNSLLFMDGGVDRGYMNAIPGIQELAKKNIKLLGTKTFLGRDYLSIGNAMGFEYDINRYMICCPTMFLPQKVPGTNNVYNALSAGLKVAMELNIDQLYCPMMCTGYGGWLINDSLKQMKDAVNCTDYIQLTNINDIVFAQRSPAELAQIINEQPKIYCNTEFYVKLY